MKDNQEYWKGVKGTFSVEFRDLIFQMLQFVPEKRPNLEEIRSHPWLSGQVSDVLTAKREIQRRKNLISN